MKRELFANLSLSHQLTISDKSHDSEQIMFLIEGVSTDNEGDESSLVWGCESVFGETFILTGTYFVSKHFLMFGTLSECLNYVVEDWKAIIKANDSLSDADQSLLGLVNRKSE